MMIPKNKNPESNVVDDFDDDPLDSLDLAELLHLVLLQGGTKEELESHRKDDLRSRCRFCATGVPDEAYKAALFDGDRSLMREFMAQAG